MITGFLKHLQYLYYQSILAKLFGLLGGFFMKAWNNSAIGRWFASDNIENRFENSILYRAVAGMFALLTRLFYKLGDIINRAVDTSFVINLAKQQIYNAISLNSRFYGSMLAVFAIGRFLFNHSVNIAFFASLLAAAVGILFIIYNKPLIFWLKGSFIYRLAEMCLGDDIKIEYLEGQEGKFSLVLGVFNGIIMTAVSAFLPVYLAPIAFVGLTAMLAVLWRYEIGLFAAVFIAPIFPTMLCAGLAVYTFISFVVYCARTKQPVFRFDIVSMLALLFMLVVGFFSLTSLAMVSSIKIFVIYVVFMLMYFVIVAEVRDKKRLYWLTSTFLVSALLVALYGIYQQFFGTNDGHAWLDEEMFESITVRVYSTLGNPNVLGEYLILAIPLAMAMIKVCKGVVSKLFYLAILGCTMLCLIFTQSRGCWIGIIIGLFVYVFMANKKYLSLLFVGMLATPFVMPQSIIDRFTSIGNVSDTSTSYRVFIWLGTLNMLKDYWAWGLGLGTDAFNRVYPFYSYSMIYAPHSHNIYLQILTETGIVGFAVMFFLMLFAWKKMIFARIKAKTELSLFSIAALAGTVAFMAQGAFDYVWYNYRVFFIFWMVLAMGIAATRIEEAEHD